MIAIGEYSYIYTKKRGIMTKKEAVAILKMPDLATSTEAHFIRHRSVSDLFEVFGMGPSLLPYFPSDYTYAPPSYLNAGGKIEPKTP